MTFSVKIEESPSLVLITLWDRVDISLIRAAVSAYLSLDEFRPGMGRLYVLDAECNLSDLNSSSLRDLSALKANEISAEMGKTGEARYPVAVVCSNRIAKALMNLYKAIFDDRSGQDVDLEIFASEGKARSWLSEKAAK
jgi:hypothetical protein